MRTARAYYSALLCLCWLFGALCLALPARAGEPAEAWRLETNKDGIKVYSRYSDGSRFKEIRVHCEMNGTLSQLVALYSDVDNYKQVISCTKSAHLVRRVSETELLYYIESEMPTPADNRDLVMRLQFAYDEDNKTLTINTNSVSGVVAPKAGIVRVPFWTGQWTVRPVSDTRMQIDYTFRVDPGGDLPSWLINMIAPVAPYRSFIKLRNGLKLPRYQGRNFVFLNPETAQRD